MNGVERWIEHGAMSDPGDFASTLTRLPSDIDAITGLSRVCSSIPTG